MTVEAIRSRLRQSGEPGSSVGRASDPRSRAPGFETRAGHLVVGVGSCSVSADFSARAVMSRW